MNSLVEKKIMTSQVVHLVMLRYTMDGSPLEEADDWAEQVRFIFADEDKAQLLVDELESNYGKPDAEYYLKSHHVVP
jgi:hypothetical protein